jgi:DNA topoisomerase-1
MAENLLIVESPAKAKTIKKYLGKSFDVLASYGHVRDLIPKEGAVDPNHNFAMKYEVVEKNEKHIQTIAKALKKAKALYLATDPDREGEAISWHIAELMKERKILETKPIFRVVFHEITQSAIKEAITKPREIAMDLVHSQQARRALDYLVGFNLSPLLWKKIRPGLSAGRVQSPALRLIVEREEEIEQFKSQEYWTIQAQVTAEEHPFTAKLVEYQGEKLTQFSVTDAETAEQIKKALDKAAKNKLIVIKIDKKQRKRNPAAPFITSTLQQEAARKLGFTTYRTMRVAQQLYEGIEIAEEGSVGLITYMRTDSVTLSQEAISEIRELIEHRYGKDNLPESKRIYQTKTKNAQEAHEAIRPTSVNHLPEDLKSYLSDEQYKLYELIWKRTIACQMIHATIDTVAVDLSAGKGNRFKANGSTIADPGFMTVYQEGIDDAKKEDSDEKMLPHLEEGQEVDLLKILPLQHFTEPPPRYTEASLVKALEEFGIGRPSTYANIIYTIKNREYVVLEQKRFKPTDVGRIVKRFLTKYFTQYVDYDFTADMEDELDAISRGEKDWVPMLDEFWLPFKDRVEDIEETVQRKDVTQEELDEKCPKCDKPLTKRLGKRGSFIGCSGYPDCDYTRGVEETAAEAEKVAGRECPECHAALVIKMGRYGKFIGCSQYPNCKHMEPLEKPADTGVNCPECHQGHLLKRKSRYGKYFYSCSTYPQCKYAVWYPPTEGTCPKCHWPVLIIKTTKRRGTEIACPQKECDYSEPYNQEESA